MRTRNGRSVTREMRLVVADRYQKTVQCFQCPRAGIRKYVHRASPCGSYVHGVGACTHTRRTLRSFQVILLLLTSGLN